MNPLVSHLQCDACGRTFDPGEIQYTCPDCGDLYGTVAIHYRAAATRDALLERLAEPPAAAEGIWRYLPLLPVAGVPPFAHPPFGPTPLIPADALAGAEGMALWIKDDGRNPSGSFKDRASVVGVADALERGAEVLTAASTGNAASSVALFCACANLPANLFVPRSAPAPKVAQLLLFGARVLAVRGTYDQAFDLALQATERFGWYSRSTAFNPVLGEGKKTVALELFEQFGRDVPDAVVVPVGDGCIIGGVHKGFCDLVHLGLAERVPRIYGAQAAGSDALAAAFAAGAERVTPIEADTVADSISVGQPRDAAKALRAARDSGGSYVVVPDDAILDAMRRLARTAGIFAEPAGAAGYAGYRSLTAAGAFAEGERVVVLVTGNGLKDVSGAMRAAAGQPIEIDPELAAVEAILGP
jgi:threonine synthase